MKKQKSYKEQLIGLIRRMQEAKREESHKKVVSETDSHRPVLHTGTVPAAQNHSLSEDNLSR
ncbi:MAG: hypothetical protein Kow00127_08360 [Bacteroidales bacterium]